MPEDDASPDVREIFADIRRTLGISGLNLFYPALAEYPAFLELHWSLVKPLAGSRELRSCAERLRAECYTRVHNYFRVADLRGYVKQDGSDSDLPQLQAAVEFFHYKDPLLLLLFCLQMQALEGPAGRPGAPTPADVSQHRTAPAFIPEETAPAPIRRRYNEIRKVLGLPYVCPEFEAMARWPVFLDAYWQFLKGLIESPLYSDCRYALRTSAWNLAGELPGPLELTFDQLTQAGLSQDEIASVGRILELFVTSLSGNLLNVAVAHIAIEGGNQRGSTLEKASESERVA